ncbi:perilipin-2-like isoform X1 [Mizuhopecten yessoensis]|nr:perilipin-2-like isoform X1 [Mizuhopecten yessoensis]XP_021345919.1 perilipin-2-like isoform X1 [Mizuhopecten yessoensis]XP_021345920.1 perilipin-2-like isoform X1 [Mizuhopecten yessoensis]
MYRKSMMQDQEKMSEEHFFTRLGNIPVVGTTWTQAWGLYQKTKDSNTIIRSTLNMAESGIKTVAETTKPMVEKYQPQIEIVNKYACQQLENLEKNYPVINKPTDELVAEGKELVQPTIDRVNAVRQYGTDTINKVGDMKQIGKDTVSNVKDYSLMQVSKAMDTPYGHFVADKVNTALTLSEEYLDKYLPEEDDENDENDSDEAKEMDEYPPNPVGRAKDLTTKLRRRMYKRAMKDLRNVQVRSQENLAKLSFTVDLIDYAKTNMESAKGRAEEKVGELQTKMSTLWTEINKETSELEEGELVPAETMETKSIIMARHLTKQLRTGLSTFSHYVPESLQPAALRERLQQTYQYTEDLYSYFKDVAKYEDMPSLALTQAKEKLGYLQSTLGFLTETFVTVPLNWLEPDVAVEVDLGDIAVDNPEPVDATDCNGHIPGADTSDSPANP